MLATAMSTRIGYDLAARIAKRALEQGRAVIEIARELSGLSEEELLNLLNPERMARPHDRNTKS